MKPTTPPEDTHSVQSTAPGTNPEPRSTQVGNFAEKHFNDLPKMLAEDKEFERKRAISGRIRGSASRDRSLVGRVAPAGSRSCEIDALTARQVLVIERKPDSLYDQGLAEARGDGSKPWIRWSRSPSTVCGWHDYSAALEAVCLTCSTETSSICANFRSTRPTAGVVSDGGEW